MLIPVVLKFAYSKINGHEFLSFLKSC